MARRPCLPLPCYKTISIYPSDPCVASQHNIDKGTLLPSRHTRLDATRHLGMAIYLLAPAWLLALTLAFVLIHPGPVPPLHNPLQPRWSRGQPRVEPEGLDLSQGIYKYPKAINLKKTVILKGLCRPALGSLPELELPHPYRSECPSKQVCRPVQALVWHRLVGLTSPGWPGQETWSSSAWVGGGRANLKLPWLAKKASTA